MKRSEMTRRMDRAKVDIDLLHDNLPEILKRLDAYSASGFTSSGGEGGGSNPPGISSSPVERAAATPDPAADVRRRFEARMIDLNRALDDLNHYAVWALRTEREGADASQPGCTIMATVGVWEAASLTNAGGNLTEKVLLGQWARRFVLRTGRLPTRAEAEARAQGRDVRVA